MYHTFTFSNAMWGHLLLLPDLFKGGLKEPMITETGHLLLPGLSDGNISVGKATGPRGYGFIREFDPEGKDQKEIELHQKFADRPQNHGHDYYIVTSERGGSYVLPTDVVASAGYPERLFVHGEDEDGEPLPRCELLYHLWRIGMGKHIDFWDPVQIWHGYDRGIPTFHNALRGATEMGPRYYEAVEKLRSLKLPGYTWEPATSFYGNLYIED